MSDEQNSNRPSHVAYQVTDRGEGNVYSNRIGAAWPHKDQQGFSIQLESTPVDGRISLRTLQGRIDEMRSAATQAPQQEVQQDTPQPEPAQPAPVQEQPEPPAPQPEQAPQPEPQPEPPAPAQDQEMER